MRSTFLSQFLCTILLHIRESLALYEIPCFTSPFSARCSASRSSLHICMPFKFPGLLGHCSSRIPVFPPSHRPRIRLGRMPRRPSLHWGKLLLTCIKSTIEIDHHSRTIFPIPDSSLTLILQQGQDLDPVALQAVLDIVDALVAERTTENGEHADCDLIPFGHDLAGGAELNIWPSVDFLTWAQLRTVIRGLRLFQVEGKSFHSYHFEIHDSEKLDIYTRIGWGNTGKPSGFSRAQLPGTALSRISSPIAKRAVDLLPATPDRKLFHIPGSHLILVLRPRAAVRPESAEAILLTSDAWVARKISIFGENSPGDFIFDHGTGDNPHTRLIVWSSMVKHLTWGQLKTVIDGLWTVLVDQHGYQYTFFEIYHRNVDVKSRLGWGAIMETDGPSRKPLLEVTQSDHTLNSTSTSSVSSSKRALQMTSAEGLPALNVSYPM